MNPARPCRSGRRKRSAEATRKKRRGRATALEIAAPKTTLDTLVSSFDAIGPTEERGHRKWCDQCGGFTGHLVFQAGPWHAQRCTRCGLLHVLRVILSRDPVSQRALLASPDLTPRALFDHAVQTLGPGTVLRAIEIHLEAAITKREAEIRAVLKKRLGDRIAFAEA